MVREPLSAATTAAVAGEPTFSSLPARGLVGGKSITS